MPKNQKREDEYARARRRAEMMPSDEEEDSAEEKFQGQVERIRRRAEMIPSDEEAGESEEESSEVDDTGPSIGSKAASGEVVDDGNEFFSEEDSDSDQNLEDDYYDGENIEDQIHTNKHGSDAGEDLHQLTMEERLRRIREGALLVQTQQAKEKLSSQGKSSKTKKEMPTLKKRANKNRPMEMSSKVPVSRYREVVNVGPQRKARDPRFEAVSGKFNYDLFRKTYDFLDGYQDAEIKELKASLKLELKKRGKDSKRHKEIQSVLSRLQTERTARHRSDKVRKILSNKKKEELEKVSQGKKPFFMKRSEKKKIEMEQRFMELKKKGKLKKYMEKRRKKNASKDHRWLPAKRKQEDVV
mmetsp:Transcript_22496/g.29196  ORF Transcript_22496/g.29196 Transcript_22496/m.29196 type:complete len:356 (+) Transcript_22496:172-1239(+)